jgi:DNA-binding NtrC family response regulator
VPPLRERREDIIPLVWHFVDAFSRRLGKTIKYIAAETLNAFQLHDWPGNIRELQNVIERAIILSKDGVLPNLLTPCGCEPLPVNATESGLWQMERMLILRTLRETDWVVGGPDGAAVKLGVKRTTLTAKLKKLGISRPDPQTAIR